MIITLNDLITTVIWIGLTLAIGSPGFVATTVIDTIISIIS